MRGHGSVYELTCHAHAAPVSDVADSGHYGDDSGRVHLRAPAGQRAQGNSRHARQSAGDVHDGDAGGRAAHPFRAGVRVADGFAHGDSARVRPIQRGPGTYRRSRQRREPRRVDHTRPAAQHDHEPRQRMGEPRGRAEMPRRLQAPARQRRSQPGQSPAAGKNVYQRFSEQDRLHRRYRWPATEGCADLQP